MKYIIGSNKKKAVDDYLAIINHTVITNHDLGHLYLVTVECEELDITQQTADLKIIKIQDPIE